MSYAVYIRTESGDEKIYSIDKKVMTSGDIIQFLRNKLNEEFPYIGSLEVANSNDEFFETDVIWEAIYESQD